MNQLKKSLSKLPAPKNDYEIVLPDSADKQDTDENIDIDRSDYVGEQYDILDETEVQMQKRVLQKLKCKTAIKYIVIFYNNNEFKFI